MLRTSGWKFPLHPCDENFRFGASKVFHASFLATILFEIGGRQVLIRVAIVHGDVPLLLSRTVLATLGMVYNMADHSASFQALGVENYKLLYTDTKHPAVPVEPQRLFGFEFPSPQQWASDEIKILARSFCFRPPITEKRSVQNVVREHVVHYSTDFLWEKTPG